MKLLIIGFIGGLVFTISGLVLEYLGVNGMCNRTGYWHLKMFDSLFYALHSETNVIIVAAFCNFVIGLAFTLAVAGLVDVIRGSSQ